MVNFPLLDGDVPLSTPYGVYISQLIRFARVSSHVTDFIAHKKNLTAKLLHQGYRYHKLRKAFYAPNFEEVEGAYWFGFICLSVCPSVYHAFCWL